MTLIIILLCFLLLHKMNDSCFHCLEMHSLAQIEIYGAGNDPTSLHNIMRVLQAPRYGKPHLRFPAYSTAVVSLIKACGLFGVFCAGFFLFFHKL